MTTILQMLDLLADSGVEYTINRYRDCASIKYYLPAGLDLAKEIEGTPKYNIPEVKRIIYSGPATIVFWEDSTKTVVKAQPDEEYYDPDKAFAMAVCKKLFGNKFNRHLTQAQKAFRKDMGNAFEESNEDICSDILQKIVDLIKSAYGE